MGDLPFYLLPFVSMVNGRRESGNLPLWGNCGPTYVIFREDFLCKHIVPILVSNNGLFHTAVRNISFKIRSQFNRFLRLTT